MFGLEWPKNDWNGLEHFKNTFKVFLVCQNNFCWPLSFQEGFFKIKEFVPEYSCEHASTVVCAIDCFQELTWVMFLCISKQKRSPHFQYLWLVKVKITLQSFLFHFLRRSISWHILQFLIMVLISIVMSLSLSSNKLDNIVNCDTNLLQWFQCLCC